MLRLTLSVAAALLVVWATPAEAYQASGRAWPDGTITVRNATPYPYAAGEAIRLWNASGVAVRFAASRSASADVVLASSGRRATSRFGGCSGGAPLGYRGAGPARVTVRAGCADDALTAKTVARLLGRVLGLGDERRVCAVMNPRLVGGAPSLCFAPDARLGGVWRCRTLEPDDLAGARRLYGGRPRARKAPLCPVFAAPRSPTAGPVTVAEDGEARVRVVVPRTPRRLARIAGALAPRPSVLIGQTLSGCLPARTAEGPGGAERYPMARWGAGTVVPLTEALTPGTWCITVWLTDELGRRSAPDTARTEVVAPQ